MARPCWIHTSFLTPSRNTAPYGPKTTTVNCRRSRATQLPSRAELGLQPSLGVVTAHTGTDSSTRSWGSVSARSPAWGSPGDQRTLRQRLGLVQRRGPDRAQLPHHRHLVHRHQPGRQLQRPVRMSGRITGRRRVDRGHRLRVLRAVGTGDVRVRGGRPALRRPGEDVAAPRGAVRLLQHADHVGIAIDGTIGQLRIRVDRTAPRSGDQFGVDLRRRERLLPKPAPRKFGSTSSRQKSCSNSILDGSSATCSSLRNSTGTNYGIRETRRPQGARSRSFSPLTAVSVLLDLGAGRGQSPHHMYDAITYYDT